MQKMFLKIYASFEINLTPFIIKMFILLNLCIEMSAWGIIERLYKPEWWKSSSCISVWTQFLFNAFDAVPL